MEIFIIILLVILSLVMIWVSFQLRSISKKETGAEQDTSKELNTILGQFNEFTRTIDRRLHDSSQRMDESVHRQHESSQKLVQNVTERLTEMLETNKQVVGFTEKLADLQNMLKNPKQRGILGEYYLETTLKNVLPPGMYTMQHYFSNGDAVDAAVYVGDKIIPIDSKFSLENYNRLVEAKEPEVQKQAEQDFKSDIKKRIDETSKYIRPQEGTLDFAFMFIPHEAIYYDLLIAEVGAIKVSTYDLIEYAFKKKVLIVSPTTFLAYLQTVLHGLRSLKIEETAKEIQKNVGKLQQHLQTYEEYHAKLGRNLSTVVNQYDQSTKEFKKIDKDIVKITGDEPLQIEEVDIDKPRIE